MWTKTEAQWMESLNSLGNQLCRGIHIEKTWHGCEVLYEPDYNWIVSVFRSYNRLDTKPRNYEDVGKNR